MHGLQKPMRSFYWAFIFLLDFCIEINPKDFQRAALEICRVCDSFPTFVASLVFPSRI